jgi:hypothetical protein
MYYYINLQLNQSKKLRVLRLIPYIRILLSVNSNHFVMIPFGSLDRLSFIQNFNLYFSEIFTALSDFIDFKALNLGSLFPHHFSLLIYLCSLLFSINSIVSVIFSLSFIKIIIHIVVF